MKYTQNNEEEVFLSYFKNKTGTLLSIGENDGKTLSNSLALIERGWKAVLVEPSPECVRRIKLLHEGNLNVEVSECAIGVESGNMLFHESGSLLNTGDVSLVSTLIPKEKDRWIPLDMQWNNYEVTVYTWKDFYKNFPYKYDFISIDAEGLDFDILKQIDLHETGTSMVCVEFNGIEPEKYIDYCGNFGLVLIHKNAENLIFAKQTDEEILNSIRHTI